MPATNSWTGWMYSLAIIEKFVLFPFLGIVDDVPFDAFIGCGISDDMVVVIGLPIFGTRCLAQYIDLF